LDDVNHSSADPTALQQSSVNGKKTDAPSLHEDLAMEEDSVIPETLPQQHMTPIAKAEQHSSSASSSPIPSLDDIFYTAVTKKQTKSPLKSPQGSEGRHKFGSDPGYLEAMQKLDEEEDSDTVDTKKSTRSLFMSASQPAKSATAATTPGKRSIKKPPPFVLPAGTSVIDVEDSASESPVVVASSAVSNRSASSNGSAGAKKRNKPAEAYQSVKTRGLAFDSSPSANTRQRTNSTSNGSKRGRGRPRKASVRID
jgi:hypothetical protein